jgi:hypothetical protein
LRLWDTAPLEVRYQARREAAALRPEAERLIKPLWREKNDPAEVVKALRADRGLSEPLRQAALRGVLRKALPPEAAPGTHPTLPDTFANDPRQARSATTEPIKEEGPRSRPQVRDCTGTPLALSPAAGQLSRDAGLLPIRQLDQRMLTGSGSHHLRRCRRGGFTGSWYQQEIAFGLGSWLSREATVFPAPFSEPRLLPVGAIASSTCSERILRNAALSSPCRAITGWKLCRKAMVAFEKRGDP